MVKIMRAIPIYFLLILIYIKLLQGFRLELFLNDCDNLNSLKRFAVAYAMPNAFPGDYGVASVNMMSKHDRPIGLLRGYFRLVFIILCYSRRIIKNITDFEVFISCNKRI